MKKIFTLLFASIVTVSIASAQSGRFDHGKPDMAYAVKEKQSAIRDINREFDYKIAVVQNNRRLNRWEKSKQIRNLEHQRDAAIARVQFKLDKNSHYGDRGYSDNKRNKW